MKNKLNPIIDGYSYYMEYILVGGYNNNRYMGAGHIEESGFPSLDRAINVSWAGILLEHRPKRSVSRKVILSRMPYELRPVKR